MTLFDVIWPKNPKISDLIDTIENLIDFTNDQEERIANLEAYVGRNDQRITTLEHDRIDHLEANLADHQAGVHARQREINEVKAELRRQRWQQRIGRRR